MPRSSLPRAARRRELLIGFEANQNRNKKVKSHTGNIWAARKANFLSQKFSRGKILTQFFLRKCSKTILTFYHGCKFTTIVVNLQPYG